MFILAEVWGWFKLGLIGLAIFIVMMIYKKIRSKLEKWGL